jgi:signal transduction histidine kinase
MRLIHWIAIDCVVGGFIAVSNAAVAVRSFPIGGARILLALLFLAAVFIPVALRRRAPATAFGGLVILGVLLSGLAPAVAGGIFLAAAYVLYTVTVEGRRRTGAAALGLLLAVLVFIGVAGSGARPRAVPAAELVPIALANVLAWMTGYSVRQRRLYVVTLQQRAASSAVAEERLRIARELHDVVAHSMSVIAVQAGYGQYVIDVSPDGAKDALGAIQATSRDALEEMRRMLGVLRQQDMTADPARIDPAPGQAPGGTAARQAPLAPAPGLAGLDRLIDRTGGAGVRVTLEVTGRARPAPAGVDLSAYRIIQEALTNVVKHAGTGARCAVSLWYTDADLVIRVTDDGGLAAVFPPVSVAAPGAGHGIIGMRERVHLCDGTFGAGPLPDGGFQVTVTLPLPAVSFAAVRGPGAESGVAVAAEPLPADSPDAPSTGDEPSVVTASPVVTGTPVVPGTPVVTGAVAGNGGSRG